MNGWWRTGHLKSKIWSGVYRVNDGRLDAEASAAGWDHYLASMPVALREKDMAWLAATMNDRSLWIAYGNRMRKGHMEQYRVNIPDAAVKLAHGEYSIAYTRAVAGLAIEGGIPTCEVSGGIRGESPLGLHMPGGSGSELHGGPGRAPFVLHWALLRGRHSGRSALPPLHPYPGVAVTSTGAAKAIVCGSGGPRGVPLRGFPQDLSFLHPLVTIGMVARMLICEQSARERMGSET